MTAPPDRADTNLHWEHGPILSTMKSLEVAHYSRLKLVLDPPRSCGIDIRVKLMGLHPDQFLTGVAEALGGLAVHVDNVVLIVEQ